MESETAGNYYDIKNANVLTILDNKLNLYRSSSERILTVTKKTSTESNRTGKNTTILISHLRYYFLSLHMMVMRKCKQRMVRENGHKNHCNNK